MKKFNVEIKAICNNHQAIRDALNLQNAEFEGTDHQVDTYFYVREGRLKLREGNIEKKLIYYERENKDGPKSCKSIIYEPKNIENLKDILVKTHGVLVVVEKKREIYFMDNVKFHIDQVKQLGEFVEIEAMGKDGVLDQAELERQCEKYMGLFRISKNDLMTASYSDMILMKGNKGGSHEEN